MHCDILLIDSPFHNYIMLLKNKIICYPNSQVTAVIIAFKQKEQIIKCFKNQLYFVVNKFRFLTASYAIVFTELLKSQFQSRTR